MNSHLTITSLVPGDEDGVGVVGVEVMTMSSVCRIEILGWVGSFAEPASRIKGFPRARTEVVDLTLGAANYGMCSLNLSCVDGLGHVLVWVTLVSRYPVALSDKRQRFELGLTVEPAAIDSFHSELLAFAGVPPRAPCCSRPPANRCSRRVRWAAALRLQSGQNPSFGELAQFAS
jgi:hypothetical protein